MKAYDPLNEEGIFKGVRQSLRDDNDSENVILSRR